MKWYNNCLEGTFTSCVFSLHFKFSLWIWTIHAKYSGHQANTHFWYNLFWQQSLLTLHHFPKWLSTMTWHFNSNIIRHQDHVNPDSSHNSSRDNCDHHCYMKVSKAQPQKRLLKTKIRSKQQHKTLNQHIIRSLIKWWAYFLILLATVKTKRGDD